jgi:hypothetical protein
MLDIEHYSRSVTGSSSREFIFGTRVFNTVAEPNLEFSDEDIMTCYYYITGYSLELKRWGNFFVDNIKDIAYNDRAFDGLVLPEGQKKLIYSLVGRQAFQQDDGFDDLIQGKGKGLIFLLHGPPGVGKTYTAGSYCSPNVEPLKKEEKMALLRS